MYVKTIAIVLATTTTLQITGVTSQLLNGIPFEIANAAVNSTTTYNSHVPVVSGAGVYGVAELSYNSPTNVDYLADLTNVTVSITTDAGVTYATTTAAVTYNAISKSANLRLPIHTAFETGSGDIYYLYHGSFFGPYISVTVGTTGEATPTANNSSSSSRKHNSNSSKNELTTTTTNNNGKEGWTQNSTDWKYTKNGQAVIGWNQIDGSWYLMDSTGTVQIGWREINGKRYLLENNGTMATGWQQSNGKWYLLKDNGAMATGWQQSNGKWYYLYADGSMASNTVVDGYTVDASGAWV